jgi:4-diphosphocytidyl-2-C-methyl-D-erythritol kinase
MLALASPAKLNLFFRVLGKKDDGYHAIASLYQAVSLCDTLHVELSREEALTCTHPFLTCSASNLVLRAADLFRRRTGLDVRARFFLEKRIPMQSGLGGGSSNAATALWGLNELTGRPAAVEELAAWSAELGSDVPFFFSGGTAYCTGRGERTVDQTPPPVPWRFWIVKPREDLSTPAVYRLCAPATLPPRCPLEALSCCLRGEWKCFNDLEPSAFLLCPSLRALKEALSGHMTGSGTAFFCLHPPRCPLPDGAQLFSVSSMQREAGKWWQSV